MHGRFSLAKRCRIMLKPVFLTQDFYNDYAHCSEIEKKDTRPYVRIQIQIDGVLWAIPLRSHISHEHVIWTDKENACGIDFSKAVVVSRPDAYISDKKVYMRPNEFAVLKRINKYDVVQKMQQYIRAYQDAKEHPDIGRNKQLLKFSTLQYFEEYL
jgi:protein AbiQ